MKKSGVLFYLVVISLTFILLGDLFLVTAGTCGEVGVCDSDNTGICSASGGVLVSVACPSGTVCNPSFNLCIDPKCSGEIGVCNLDNTGICSQSIPFNPDFGMIQSYSCPSGTVCNPSFNLCIDPKCSGEIGVCNSDNTGICLPDGLGGVYSMNCSGGCSDSKCNNGEVTFNYDVLGRIKLKDYHGAGDNVAYSYYGTTNTLQQINVGGKEIYSYDSFGELLREVYPGFHDKDTFYTYYPAGSPFEGQTNSITQNGVTTSYTYDSENRVQKKKTTDSFFGKTTEETYSYDGDDRLIQVAMPGKTLKYTYDSKGNLVKDEIERIVEGKKVVESADYNYDEGGDIVDVSDNTGVKTNYSYEPSEYSCQKIKCTNFVCSADSDCYTFYDCDSGTCVPYDCSEYTFIDSTCDYSKITSRNTNNFNVSAVYDSETAEVEKYCNGKDCYTPVEKYNSDNLLSEDDNFIYTYNTKFQVISKKNKETSEVANYEYDSNGRVKKEIDGPKDFKEYFYDALGDLVVIKFTVAGVSSSVSIPGASGFAVKNVFLNFMSIITGRAITGFDVSESGTQELTYFATSPGDTESFVSEQEFDSLVQDYEKTNGRITENAEQSVCFDIDGNLSFSDSLFNPSYVFYQGEYNFDSCIDNVTLTEHYCGKTIPLFGVAVDKSKDETCKYGCLEGACLIEPIGNYNQTIVLPENQTTIINENETEFPNSPLAPRAV